MEKTLKLLFNIEADEIKPVLLSFLLAFFWGVSQMFSYTSANTIFLDRYGAEFLAYSFIFNAVLIPLTGLAIMKISEKVSFLKYITGTIAFFCVSLVSFRFLLSVEGIRWPAMVYLLWLDVEGVLSGVLFYNILNKLFNIRQSKRVFGPANLGTDVAFMITGFIIPFIVTFTGALNLTQFAAGFDFLSIFVFIWIYISFRDKMKSADTGQEAENPEEEPDAGKTTLKSLFKNRFILGILSLSSLAAVAACFVENAYLAQAESYITDEAKLASFLGLFYSISSIAVILVKGLIATRFMKVFGMLASLVVTPVLIGLAALVFVLSSKMSFPALWVFILAVSVKLVQDVMASTIYSSTYFNLLQSLSSKIKDRVTNLSETVVSNIITGIAGAVLLVMTQVFHAGAAGICLALLAVVVLWVLLSFFLGKQYRKNLGEMLNNKVLPGAELQINDSNITNALVGSLNSKFSKEVVYGMDMLDKANFPELKKMMPALAASQDPAVRGRAAEYYEKKGIKEDTAFLIERLGNETDPANTACWLRALAAASECGSTELIEPYLKHADPEISTGAYTALIRHCGMEGILIAGSELIKLSRSGSAEERKFAAGAVEKIGMGTLYRVLMPLLEDADIEVRKSAIQAAGALQHPKLVPALINNISNSELRPAIIKSLVKGTDAVLPALEEVYALKPENRELVAYLYGRIKTREAAALLRAKLNEPDRGVLLEIFHSLELCRYVPDRKDAQTLEKILAGWAQYAAKIMFALGDLENTGFAGSETSHADGRDALVHEALKQELRKIKEVFFSIISMLYPNCGVKDARFSYFFGDSEEKKAVAVELLDDILDKNRKKYILPVIEDSVPATSREALGQLFPEKLLGRKNRLEEIREGGAWQNEWLKTVAAHSLEKSRDSGPVVDMVMTLHKASIFSEIPDEILAKMANYVQVKKYPANTPVFRKGDEGSTLYIIESGSVKVHVGARIITELKSGDIFGELSALDPEPRTADVTTTADSVILCITHADIYRIINEWIEVAEGIIQILCQRIRKTFAEGTIQKKGMVLPEAENAVPEAAGRREEKTKLTGIEKLLVFRTLGIFNGVPDNILHNLSTISNEQFLKAGAALFNKGDSGTSMFIIVKGRVKVHDGDKTIAVLGDREIIGELAALSSETRSASVTALGGTRLLKITQESLYEIMWDQREVAIEFIEILTGRLRDLMK